MTAERITTPAVLARSVDYGEADRICTLLTPERGKTSVLAKAARRSRKRFGGALSLFVLGEAVIRPTRGELGLLERFDAREDFSGRISADLVKVAHGSYLLELAREFWPPEQRDPELFELVVTAMRVLADHPASPSLLRSYELKLLALVGLVPAIDHCAACGLVIEPASLPELAFGIDGSGVFCPGCVDQQASPRTIPAALHEHLVALVRGSLSEAAVQAVERPVARAARDLMLEVTRHHLGKELRSVQFISQLAGLG